MRIIPLLLVTVLVLTVISCAPKKINEILATPSRYADKNVEVEGTVVDSYSVIGRGAYQIQDDTGALWIVSDGGVPRKGAKVAVKGKIRDGFSLGDLVPLPDPLASGLVMVESSHRARN